MSSGLFNPDDKVDQEHHLHGGIKVVKDLNSLPRPSVEPPCIWLQCLIYFQSLELSLLAQLSTATRARGAGSKCPKCRDYIIAEDEYPGIGNADKAS